MLALPPLEHLQMTSGYFRLILRSFGDTAEHRASILAGTGVTEQMLRDSSAEITLFQQVRQIENVAAVFGDDWALRSPELWNASSHGPLGVALVAAPDMGAMMKVIVQFAFVRSPYFRMDLRRGPIWCQLEYELTVALEDRLWRPMMEISFIGIRASLASTLAAAPTQARFFFACPEPDHAEEVRAILGENVVYGASRNAIRFPTAWLALAAPFADAALYDVAIAELQAAKARIAAPGGLRSRVERLLSSLPAGRISADEVARMTGVSRRTLVRRLAESGAGYRELVDAELRTRAARLLQEGELSRTEIAELLGYTDRTSFSRACRRWFGRQTGPPS